MDNNKNDQYYVSKIRNELNFILRHTHEITKEKLYQDEVFLNAMLFSFVQIQENANRLSNDYRREHFEIPWADISGLRNRIVHDYGNVDLSVIYDTLVIDIPALAKLLDK